jgi:hypothetical protein
MAACQKVPTQNGAPAEPFHAPRASAPVSSAAGSASPVAASPPMVIERDAGAGVTSPTAASLVSEVSFEGTRVAVGVVGDRCAVTFKGGDVVHLDMAPPCYVLVWNEPPVRRSL